MIIVTLLMCLFLFVCICFGIGQVVWIYLDAKERGDRLKIVWALFLRYFLFYTLFITLPLIVYLLISRSYASSCPTCNEKIRPDYVTCPRCGQHLKEKCLNCGRSIEKVGIIVELFKRVIK